MHKQQVDYMTYKEGMEQISSTMMEELIEKVEAYDYTTYRPEDVQKALEAPVCTIENFAALLSPEAIPFLEQMAQKAEEVRRRHFGNTVALFTPLYLSNYCENHCVYCGFNCHNQIRRAKLELADIEREMEAIAKTGLEEILLLTGESRKKSDVKYIGEACKMAGRYFKTIGLEVYPMNTDEYAYLKKCGADYVTVFQETYEPSNYEKFHLKGHKRVFPYRFYAQERALKGGMRGVAFAALLGLGDFRTDAFATGLHGYSLQRKYPHADISFSVPRLRPTVNQSQLRAKDVGERELLQVILAYRLFMPFAGITLSTREREGFRDPVMGLAATKVSAGVSTGVGTHEAKTKEKGEQQFEIADGRNVHQMYTAIKNRGLQPIMNDYIYV